MSEITLRLRKLHEKQQYILDQAKRFNVLKCGRRFGKTDLSKELTIQPMLDGHAVGYWTPTYKDLNKVWAELKKTLKPLIVNKNEQLKTLTIITGGTLDMWSMEDPDSGRGFAYKRAIVDECEKARHLKTAWEETIRATLVDFKGDAWFMSTPKFGETYFKTKLFKNELKLESWKSFRFSSYDNPHIDKEEIEEARQLLDDYTFRCEYLAEDVNVTLRPFAFQFKEEKHTSKEPAYDIRKQLIVSVDFNLMPFCVTFHHYWSDANGLHCHQFDEAEIPNGSIPEMIDLIKARYPASLPNCILTGDAMGKRGDMSQRDNASLYKQLLRGLRLRDSQLKVRSNPTHENSRTDFNYFLFHFPDYKVSSKCEKTIRDLYNVEIDAYGSIIKANRENADQRADYIDTLRYLIHNLLNPWIQQHQKRLVNKTK